MNCTMQHNTECPICYDSTNNPITLPCCKKSFCMECLEGWNPGLDNYVNGNRTCPNCRALVPPTTEALRTIFLYEEISISLSMHLLEAPYMELPLPPFPFTGLGQVATRRFYESMQTTYTKPVRQFGQKYGFGVDVVDSIIPSTPPQPLRLPVSTIQAVRDNNYLTVRNFLGPLPIPPQRLNAVCRTSGDTLLHLAVQANNLEMVKVLLALGAAVNATNKASATSLFFAVKIEGNDDAVAKTLIRYGAKKASTIFPTSVVNPMPDYLLQGTAQVLGKLELARILSKEALGRHCRVQVNGATKRGIITKYDIFCSEILLNDTKELVVALTRNVKVCKPLFFDFRGIDLSVLCRNPPSTNDSPGHHGIETPGDRQRRHFVAGERPTQSRASRHQGFLSPMGAGNSFANYRSPTDDLSPVNAGNTFANYRSPTDDLSRMGAGNSFANYHSPTDDIIFGRYSPYRPPVRDQSIRQAATDDLVDALIVLEQQARNGNLSPQG